MTVLRVGTRGSDLALTQTRWVCQQLRDRHSDLSIEEIIIKTHGDTATDQPFDSSWPVGSFVSALEQALVEQRIDFAVHSYKDVPSQTAAGLALAAIPPREAVYDVLVTREAVTLDDLPAGFRIGTSSPRRSAQLMRLGDVRIVPIRGNVPTRVEKIQGDEVDAVVLAAAGLNRLGIVPEHLVDLPPERFVPSPAQGALAIQTREVDEARAIVSVIDDPATRRAVEAERAFLAQVEAGCQTPLGAWAVLEADEITLRAELYSEDGSAGVAGEAEGADPQEVGRGLAERMLQELAGAARE